MAIDFPDSPSNNDIYTVNGKRWIYSSGKWSIYGSTAPDATASDTEPTGVGDGHIWYRSDQSQTLIRYDNTWVEVGSAGGFDNASTSFPTSLDSATGFAAVEALQAKVGVDSSAVTSSHDYKIADHASRITTLEGASGGSLVFVTSTSASAVSSVSIDGCFTADYDNYLVVMKGTAASSATHEGRLRYRASGVTETGSVYDNNLIYLNTGSGVSGLRLSTNFKYFSAFSLSNPTDAYAYIYRPFVSGVTTGLIGQGAGTTGNSLYVNGHNTTSTTQYDGVNFYHATGGTFTADFYVYGVATS